MNESDAEIVGALLDQLIAQYRAGIAVDIEQQCAEHPHLASQLRELFETQRALESMKVGRQNAQPPIFAEQHPTLGGYKVVRELARGGMGVVYEAIQLSLSRRVALKVISSHLQSKEESVERFRREASVASQLHHSNIVPVFDVGQEGAIRYYAMQFIRGQSLDQVIVQMKRLREDTRSADAALFEHVARVGVQISEALSAAHGAGILHRDVKPSNILVDENGSAWLTDFGLATLVDDSSASGPLTESGDILGTLRYMAPERLAGQQDQRCDIYSLAATLYEMLTLRTAVSAVDRVRLLEQIANHPVLPPRHFIANVPRDLETILLKGLCKEPGQRYQDAGQLADDFRLFLLDRPIRARRIGWLEVGRRWFYRNPVLTGLGMALILLLVLTCIGWQANRSLQFERDQVLLMYRRATTAENEASLRALINEVASYRSSLEPELTSRRLQLEWLASSNLPASMRSELRNEIAACWMRADWFLEPSSTAVDAVRVALDRNRSRMAAVDSHGIVKICDFPSLDHSVVLQALAFEPLSLRFTRDSRYLIVSANSYFQIYDSLVGRPVYSGTQVVGGCDVSGPVHRAAFRHGDQRITVEAIDTQPTQLIMEHHARSKVEALKISPSGDRLAYLTENELIVVRIPSEQVETVESVKHSGMLEWSPDGKWLAVTDHQHGIEIWDIERGEIAVELPTLGSVIAYLDWDASSQLIASQTWDGCFQVQHAWSGKMLARTKRHVGQAEFSHDGRSLGWSFDQGKVRLISWFTGLRTDLPGIATAQQEMPLTFSFHPTKPLLAIGTTSRVLFMNLLNGRRLAEVPSSQIVTTGFTQNGQIFYVIGTTKTESWPIAWTIEEDDCQIGQPTTLQTPQLTSGFLLPDGQRLMATTASQEVMEIDLAAGCTARVLGNSGGLAVRQLGHGNLLALHDWHKPVIEIRRLDTGSVVGKLNTGQNALVFANPNCSQLVTTNGMHINAWSVEDLADPLRSIMPTMVIGSPVAFTSDGQIAVVQSVPYELQLIHWQSGRRLTKLSFDFSDSITQLSFDPTDRYLVALCTRTGVVRKWDLATLDAALRDLGLF